jgi:8-oxo-dGTP pyrophosphatase MutT (NUDIX family)
VPKTKQKAKNGSKERRQYAALPLRFTDEGKMQVLLLTSRSTRRWVIPKGWPMRKLSPAAAAAQEAYEEAGLEGMIEGEMPIGRYHYDKQVGSGTTRVAVEVFLMRVLRQLASWPEQAERETRWCDPDEAAALVAEPELAALLRGLRDGPALAAFTV